MKFSIAAGGLIAVLATHPAAGASTEWQEAAGGRVRLVTAGPVDANGELRGALQIELKPGWKTYWRDPGASGVPPQIKLAPDAGWQSATIEYPAPQWHKDDYGSWAGYDYTVALPVVLQAEAGSAPPSVQGSIFLGICETICVPLQAPLSLIVDTRSTPAEDNALVQSAWAALPKPASPDFGVSKVEAKKDDMIDVSVNAPEGTEFFIAGESGYVLAPPKPLGDGRFSVHIIAKPKQKPEGDGLRYTLGSPEGAVSGTIPYP